MKKFKKLTAAVAATIMAATLVAPMAMNFSASADDVTITIQHGEKDNQASFGTFTGYKLLDVVKTGEGDDAGYLYTVNENASALLRAASGESTDDAVMEAINDKDFDAEAFAKAVADELTKEGKDYSGVTTISFEDGQNSDLTAEASDGYYLIIESPKGENGVLSRYIVDTVESKNLTVYTKKSLASFDKEIMDVNDSTNDATTWGKSADWDIGDDVPFALIATLPTDYDNYDWYQLIFHDELQGDVFGTPKNFKLYVIPAGETGLGNDGKYGDTYLVKENFTVEDDENDALTGKTGTQFKYTIADVDDLIKETELESGNGAKVVLYYEAELTTEAELGKPGNWNGAYIDFTDNYYYDGEGGDTTSKSTKAQVVAYTYVVDITKVDDNKDNPKLLAGATFKLEKWSYAENVWKLLKNDVTGEDGKFTYEGIDDGKYKLTENEAPTGYSGLTGSVEFTVTNGHAVTDTTSYALATTSDNKLGVEFSVKDYKDSVDDDAAVGASIVNTTGTKLPSTGGIGTTLFYLGGGAMVAVAGIFLITKKRMSKSEG